MTPRAAGRMMMRHQTLEETDSSKKLANVKKNFVYSILDRLVLNEHFNAILRTLNNAKLDV